MMTSMLTGSLQPPPFRRRPLARQLSRNGEVVLEYDPSDLSTLFDANGQSITSMEQPVATMLDKGQGLRRGAEVLANGSFDSDLSGWSTNSPGYWQAVDGAAYHPFSGSYYELFQRFSLNTSSTYEVVAKLRVISGTAQIFLKDAADVATSFPRSTPGLWEFRAFTQGDKVELGFARASSGAEFYVDSVSVRELPGHHAYQTDSAKRPVVTARVNLLDHSEDFAAAPWIHNSVTLADGVFTATEDASTGPVRSISAMTAGGGDFVYSVELRADVPHQMVLQVPAPSYASYLAQKTIDVTTEWQRFDITFSGEAAAVWHRAASTGDSFQIDKAQLNYGTEVGRYQRVGDTDADAADYDWRGFPIGLRTDGVDDGVVTGPIDWGRVDKMLCVAGVQKLSDAATAMLLEFGDKGVVSQNAFALLAPSYTGSNSYRAVSLQSNSGSGRFAPAPDASVLTAQVDGAASLTSLRRNGEVVEANSQALTADVFMAERLYLFNRVDGSMPFNGVFYGLLLAGGQYPESLVKAAELRMAHKLGRTQL